MRFFFIFSRSETNNKAMDINYSVKNTATMVSSDYSIFQ